MRFVFFFNDTATTEIYTLSLHDALPIYSNEAKIRYGLTLGMYFSINKNWQLRIGIFRIFQLDLGVEVARGRSISEL